MPKARKKTGGSLLKVAPKKKKRLSQRGLDEQYTGPEPEFYGPVKDMELARGFNYYNYHSNVKDAKKYLAEYLVERNRTDDSKMVKACPDVFVLPTYGWLARMAVKGAEFEETVQEKLDRHVDYLCTHGFNKLEKRDEKKEERQVGPTIQDRVKEQAWDIGAELEKWKDMCTSNESTWALVSLQNKPLEYLRGNNCNQAHARVIKKDYEAELAEINHAILKTDEDMVEGYSHMSTSDKHRFVTFLQDVIDACDMIIGESLANRKQRTKKPRSAEKQVAKLKYSPKNDDLGIVSEKPLSLIGATAAVIYQCKFRKIGVLIADDSMGFKAKGTTILNVNENLSVRKTLRKPKEQLKECKGLSKTKFDKWFTGINAVETRLTPRFGDDTVILKVFK